MMRVVQRPPRLAITQMRKSCSSTKATSQATRSCAVESQEPQPEKPGRVQADDERIMRGRRLDRALRQEPSRVSPGEDELRASLQRDEAENDQRRRHAALFSETRLAVKPGPSALSTARGGKPCFKTRSSTKNTVGADMLP